MSSSGSQEKIKFGDFAQSLGARRLKGEQTHQQELEHLLVDQPRVGSAWLGSQPKRGVDPRQVAAVT